VKKKKKRKLLGSGPNVLKEGGAVLQNRYSSNDKGGKKDSNPAEENEPYIDTTGKMGEGVGRNSPDHAQRKAASSPPELRILA